MLGDCVSCCNFLFVRLIWMWLLMMVMVVGMVFLVWMMFLILWVVFKFWG